MCLILCAWRQHPRYPLVLAANRDEFHQRPSAPLAPWQQAPILAGRDLSAGGTWLGANRAGWVAAVTNVRGSAPAPASARSRGELPCRFLERGVDAATEAARIHARRTAYNGFNLLLFDTTSLWYVGSAAEESPRALPAGVYGLSNAGLDTPWPKVSGGKQALREWLDSGADASALLPILADRSQPGDGELPDTGVGLALERTLAPRFITGEHYGTRASSIVLADTNGDIRFWERRFGPNGLLLDESGYHWRGGAATPQPIARIEELG